MEVLVLCVIIYAVFLYVMIRGAIYEKHKKQQYREKMRNLYGSFQERTYSPEELSKIARYFIRFHGDNVIDDITWNDLSMDDVFAKINFTQSSSGEEYLYAMLRQPLLTDKESKHAKMDKHIQYMMKNEEQRLDTLMLFHEMGKTGKFSLFDYMDHLKDLGERSNLKHYVLIGMLVLSIAMIFFNTSLGVALLIGVACINMVTYMKEKGVAQPYITSFAYIIRMIKCADEILKCEYESDMDEYIKSLQIKRNKFKPFEKNSGMVMKMNSASGNIDDMIFDYLKMLTHFDIIKFNKMLSLVKKNEHEIYALAEDLGYLDTIISIAYFRAALPHYCVPELKEGIDAHFEIKNGFHPLISSPVSNTFIQNRGMIVTGSNASGKSTFLKMTAINAILAQTVYTCAADRYCGNYYKIYSSMALRDSLEEGESYYIVEIKALKRIVNVAIQKNENPLLCFVDEVLRGTNTVERIAASTQILEKLSEKGVICFAATHDIELTHLLEAKYDNFHFEEEIKNGDVLFSYRLLNGRAHTRNAIKLLEIIGFSEDIIKKADNMAKKFLDSGEWGN